MSRILCVKRALSPFRRRFERIDVDRMVELQQVASLGLGGGDESALAAVEQAHRLGRPPHLARPLTAEGTLGRIVILLQLIAVDEGGR